MTKPHKVITKKLIALGILAFLVAILSLIKLIPFVAEHVFSRGISRAYIFGLSSITKFFGFSLFEILLVIFIITLLFLIVKWIYLISRKRDFYFFKSIFNVLIVALSILTVYTLSASFGYYRDPLPVPQHNGQILDKNQMEDTILYFLEDFQYVSENISRNEQGYVDMPYDYDELNTLLMEEYQRIGNFDGYLSSFTPPVKPIFFSSIMSYQSISGIAIAPTGEANINKLLRPNDKILTMAHELAHIKGVMREYEANLLSYYVAITSPNIYFRYAGYMYTMPRLMQAAFMTLDSETYADCLAMYPRLALDERAYEYSFWAEYESVLDKVSGFFNDLYLKLSGVQDGTDSYRDTGDTDSTIDPDTGEVEYTIIEYSPVQKMYIQLYLDNNI